MRVVIAPDSFGGTLTSVEAAAAMTEGWRRVRSDDDLAVIPMADGGEGTLDAVEAAPGATSRHTVEVADARGVAVDASWLKLPDGTGLVEVAEAIGLKRLTPDRRDPLQATSYGAGQLVLAAAAHSARVVIGLGGSATVDGGAGFATALGHRLLRVDGNGVKVGASYLDALERIEPGPGPAVPLVAASDVTNPLLGPAGAAAVYGPQKGASDDDVVILEERLAHFAEVVERTLPGGPWRELAGSGAAGGLGFALAAFCDASFRSGAELVAELVGLGPALGDADIVLTGEGSLDGQSLQGKVCGYVLGRARGHGCRVLAVAGRFRDGAEGDFDHAAELGPEGRRRAAALVAARTADLAHAAGGGHQRLK